MVEVPYTAEYNVFAIESQHSKQPENMNDTSLMKKIDSNTTPNSSDMCNNVFKNDQNADDHEDERVVLADLIENLKCDIDENKKIQKQLRNTNTTLTHELKECKSTLEETNRTLGESNRTRDRYLVALHDKEVELAKYKTFKDRTIKNDTLECKLKETQAVLAQKEHDIKEGLKLKSYKIFVVKEKHDELVKQSLLTKSSYEGLVKEKNKHLKKAQSEKPCLYEISYDKYDIANMFAPNKEETLTLEKESRSKLNKDLVKPYDYTKQNSLYEIKPPTWEYLDQLAHANEVQKKMCSNDMVHNYYLEEAKNKAQLQKDKALNTKPSVQRSARLPNTANGNKPKPRNYNQQPRNWPPSMSSHVSNRTINITKPPRNQKPFLKSKDLACPTCKKCICSENHDECILKYLFKIPIGQKFSPKKSSVVYLKTPPPRFGLTWNPTGRIFTYVGLRWIPIKRSIDTCFNMNDSASALGTETHNPNTVICANSLSLSAVTMEILLDPSSNKLCGRNQALKEYFNNVGISYQTSSVKTPQQNGVVEQRIWTLVEAARTMLIFLCAPLFLWAKAIATAKPDISFLHVFEALYYPNNDCDDIGNLCAKAMYDDYIGGQPSAAPRTAPAALAP
ncbi:ribonuclease H-like domain-containing protein [Tanacetum coccineum]